MENLKIQQRILGDKGLISYLIFIYMLVPFSTDMYLPSLPGMEKYFQATPVLVNLSLTCFFLSYAVSVVFWGPLSDKYGRKSCLILGSLLYISSSLFCAHANNIYILVAFRILQGVSVAAISTMVLAVVKDCYQGKKREDVLAIIYTLCGLGPIIAPIAGAQLLRVASWRFSFTMLAVLGLVSLIFALCYQETLRDEERYRGKLSEANKQLGVVIKNRSFFYPVIIFSLVSAPFMGYVAISSYIYQQYFALSARMYSYFFALNSFLTIFAPLIYIKFFRNFNKKALGYAYALGSVAIGLLIFWGGRASPLVFFICFLPYAMLISSVSTYSMHWIMDQQQGESGTAASVISVTGTVVSCTCMLTAPLFTGDFVAGLAWLVIGFGALTAVFWWLFLKSPLPCVGIKTAKADDRAGAINP